MARTSKARTSCMNRAGARLAVAARHAAGRPPPALTNTLAHSLSEHKAHTVSMRPFCVDLCQSSNASSSSDQINQLIYLGWAICAPHQSA